MTEQTSDIPKLAVAGTADTKMEAVEDGIAVHIPVCLTDEERSSTEDFLNAFGLPETAVFDYYSLR